MGVFKNIKISAKIMSLAIFMELLIIVTAFHGISMMKDISGEYAGTYENDALAAMYSYRMGLDLQKASYAVNLAATTKDSGKHDKAVKTLNSALDELDDSIAQIEKRAQSPEAKNLVAKSKTLAGTMRSQGMASIQGRTNLEEVLPETNAGIQGFVKAANELDTLVRDCVNAAKAAAQSEMDTTNGEVSSEMVKNIIISVILVIVSLGISWVLANHISTRIKEITAAAEQIAEGDLTHEIYNASGDEIGDTAANFEIMRQRVHETISDINVAAEQVAAGSKNVSEASVALSQGASEQAASVEELSASISEIASQTASNATNADRANQLTVLAQENANVGNTEMKNMLGAMEAINESSNNISKIIKVIDEIAFQTNILALNAAVEAARAGQHGKGFAVVAEEVRNLAARSAKAAKETTDMIEGSIEKVNGGREIANKTADALQTIVGNVTEVADIVAAIAKASNEQKVALDQINQGVLQVSQVVQSNSATSEEAASASEELNAQAERMRETVSRFKLSNGITHVERPAISRPQSVASRPQPVASVSRPASSTIQKPITQMSGARPAIKPAAPGVKPKKIALTDDEGFGKY